MAHILSIGVGLFSDVSFSTDLASFSMVNAATLTEANWRTLFGTEVLDNVAGGGAGAFRRIYNIRELPQMGVPPNIVNVPNYGTKASKQIQGQADSPSFEIVLNYVPQAWQDTANYIGDYVGNSFVYPFRFTLLNTEPTGGGTAAVKWASLNAAAFGLGTVANSQYFFAGKLEALQISPQLTDANQATLTVSMQSDLYGPYTI